MKGIEVKNILLLNGYKLKEVAELIGESPQNFNSMLLTQDIKTGILERISNAIKKPLYWFYQQTGNLEHAETSKQGADEVQQLKAEVSKLKEENALFETYVNTLEATQLLIMKQNEILKQRLDSQNTQSGDPESTEQKIA